MNEIVHIGNSDIYIKEYKGQRVITFRDIDLVHNRPNGTANKRFLDNKERFIEGQDYFVVSNSEIRKSQLFPISDNDFTNKALITEQGYLMLVKSFTDDLAWDVQRQLVNGYFRVRQMANDLSPQMQMLYGMLDQMAQTERQAKEAKEIAQKAIDTTENIKEAVKPISENWRYEINEKFNRIQKGTEKPFSILRSEMYKELDKRAGCNLKARLTKRKEKMTENRCTKTEIDKANYMDVIESDKRLREIFSKIVSEYEIKYCA